MIGKTKSLNKFIDRCRETQHFVDIAEASISLMKRDLKSAGNRTSTNEALGFSKKKYSALNIPTDQFSGRSNRFLRNSREFAICRLYTHFGEYCQNALGEAYKTNPLLVVGSFEGALKYHEIIKLGDFDSIGDHMVEAVFKKLEGERSSKRTIEKLISSLKLEINTDAIDNALGYFEIRHLLVHRAGKVDQAFSDRYGSLIGVPMHHGSKLHLPAGLFGRAFLAVETMLTEIDRTLVEKEVAKAHT